MNYTGETYQAPSGQWSWRIRDEHGEICGGAGYATEESAQQAMNDQLAYQLDGERQ